MEYINRNLQKIREKIALDRLNAVVPIPLSINGATGAVTASRLEVVVSVLEIT